MFHALPQGEYPAAVTPVRIIGIGSPFGDDQLAWHIVETLQQDAHFPQLQQQQLSFIKADRPGAGLLELMQGADLVILIDAMKSGARQGTIRRFEEHEIEDLTVPLSSHGFGVTAALTLAQALNAMPKKLILYGIEVQETEGIKFDSSLYDIEAIARKITTDAGLLKA